MYVIKSVICDQVELIDFINIDFKVFSAHLLLSVHVTEILKIIFIKATNYL